MPEEDRSAKAAVLSELIGSRTAEIPKRPEGAPEVLAKSKHASELAWHRNRLIQKFRERGLISGEMRPPERASGSATGGNRKHNQEFGPGSLGARLAKYLNPKQISDEHPAVVALLLRSQPADLRSEVLRALPGSQARAVMRLLRAGRASQSGVERPKVDRARKRTETEVVTKSQTNAEIDEAPKPKVEPEAADHLETEAKIANDGQSTTTSSRRSSR